MRDLPEPPSDLLNGAALFLDFDGTLVELAATPDAVQIPVALPPLLARLGQRLDGRLAIVSGRSLAALDAFLPGLRIATSGSHGLEMRSADGGVEPLAVPAGVAPAQAAALAFATRRPGLLAEIKPAGVALHFRQAPDAARAVEAFMQDLAREHELRIQRGAMVVELRPGGADKGDAIRAFMSRAPFANGRPVFVGDDLTDEHAFAAAAEMGGAGILVGPLRESAAHYRLPFVAAVTAWLEAAA